jgi:endoglucanase
MGRFFGTFAFLMTFIPAANSIIRGINFWGLETENMNFMCNWAGGHDVAWNVAKIKELGFNTLRIPFSHDYIVNNDFSALDSAFDEAEKNGLNIVLDYHRLHKTHQSFQPYDQEVSFDTFLYSWESILKRYQDRECLYAIDIWNEYQGSSFQEWNNLARQIVSFIEDKFPGRFTYFVGGISWGGNIHDMNLNLEDLSYSDRIRYSIHKYWFSDVEKFEDKWEFSFHPQKSIINVGEWGYMSDQQKQIDWANRFIAYLRRVGVRDTFFWGWSWNSADTAGILKEDCESVDYSKIDMLHTLWDDRRNLRGVCV